MQADIQPWVVVGRITAILGMGLALSISILLYLGAIWLWATIALVVGGLFFGMMVLVERSKAARSMSGRPPAALEP